MIMADGGVTFFKLGSLFNNVLDHEHFQTKSDIAIIQDGSLTCYWRIRGNE